jgi:hypothetical protein
VELVSYGVLLPSAAVSPYETPLCAGEFSVQPTVTEVAVALVVGLLITRGAVMVIVLDADLVLSCALVAVIVADVPVAGAVKTPPEVMVPAEVAQFTAEE